MVCLASPLLASPDEPPSREISVKVGWAGLSAWDVRLIVQPSGQFVTVDGIASSQFGAALTIPRGSALGVRVRTENGQPFSVPEMAIPAGESEFLLFLQGDAPLITRAMLIPSDLKTFARGTSVFINLSVNRLRCTLGGQTVELAPGEVLPCSFAPKSRKVMVLVVEHFQDGRWKANSSTPLIFNENMRSVIGFGPGDARQGSLPTCSVYENCPVPVAPIVLVPPVAEPATPAGTPLPDPPAK